MKHIAFLFILIAMLLCSCGSNTTKSEITAEIAIHRHPVHSDAHSWHCPGHSLYLPIVVKRINNEEMVLKQELGGYKEYILRIRYRLIPFIW